MKKQPVVIIVVLLIVFGAVIWYLYENSIKTNGNPWDALPGNPSFVVEINTPAKTLELLDENPIWKSLNNTLLFKRVSLRIIQLDSLLRQNNKVLEGLKNNTLLIAFYNNGENGLSTLFVSRFRQNPSPAYIQHYLQNYLGSQYGVIVKPYGKYNLFTVADLPHDLKYHFAVIDGVLVFSTDENIVERSVNVYSSKTGVLYRNGSLEYLRKTAGKKAVIKLFVNYSEFGETLGGAAAQDFDKSIGFIKNIAGWTETDVIIKNKELLFTGYTVGLKNKFLDNFEKAANGNAVFNLIPFDASFVLLLNGLNIGKEIKDVVKKYKPTVKKIAAGLKNGVTLFSNATSPKEYKSKLYLLVKNDNSVSNDFEKLAKLTGSSYKTVYSGKYEIRKINYKSLWEKLLGNAFSGIYGNYFTVVSDFVVFANSGNALKRLIDYYETGKTLDLNNNFKKLSDNLQSNTNITLLIKPPAFMGLLSKYLSGDMVNALKNSEETVAGFQNVLFQYTKEGERFYNNFYIGFNKSVQEENLSLWKTALNDKIVGKPYLVKNFRTGKYDIIVFDKSHYMYLINANGKILWKKKLIQSPISGIEQVDYYKNGKIQFLFNTEDNIYIIDRKGRFTGNYPVRLNPAATNGLALFDYNRKKDYRIMIAQADKRIYDYNIKGNKIKGWATPKMPNIVTDKVQRLVINNKDYIFVTDIDNNVKILNRRGNVRIKLKGKVDKASNSIFYANKTNSKGIILTTDRQGRLTYISSSGRITHTVFGKFSAEHYFLYEDFDGNGRKDFIYVDNNRLKIFDRFKNLLFSYTFKSTITSKPQFFTIGKGKRILGITAGEEKTVYLFDKNGNTLISKGLVGEIPFTVGSLNNNKEINLITATGNVLYNYRLR